ncbi:hypothetical protein HD806DRAFT_444824 [Xylariaceae sp. AK1471]|nr:hypothetical protein HD806DRAFT_444824 [Xylariaceae sp. AK1471]
MKFVPKRGGLVRFSGARGMITTGVKLAGATIQPKIEGIAEPGKEGVRFLGVLVDQRLKRNYHRREISKKQSTQQYAVTKLGNSAWGTSIAKSRQLYVAVVWSTLV